MPKQTKLPDGEFFVYIDSRLAGDMFAIGRERDIDPEETEAIKARRRAYYLTFEPNWEPVPWISDPFHRYDSYPPPMTPDLVHKCTRIISAPKRGLTEYHEVRDFAAETGAYRVVSPEWKVAIESLEPNMHEFFAHDVVFPDFVLPRYIFRDRQFVMCTTGSEPVGLHQPTGSASSITVSRRTLAGRYWVRQIGWFYCFISRDLAHKLLPLLPPKTRFEPLTVVD